MLKRTETYVDFNGTERTEDFYFNLTQAEIVELELGIEGGLVQMIETIIAAKDLPTIVDVFKKLLLKAYGEKSPDGKYFRKSAEISANFESTEAYSKIFMELSTDAAKAADFFNKVIPEVKNKQSATTN